MTEKPTEPFTGVHHPNHPSKTFTVTNHRDLHEAIAQLGAKTIESPDTLVENNRVRPIWNVSQWDLTADYKAGVSVWREEVSSENKKEPPSLAEQIEQELTASGIK